MNGKEDPDVERVFPTESVNVLIWKKSLDMLETARRAFAEAKWQTACTTLGQFGERIQGQILQSLLHHSKQF